MLNVSLDPPGLGFRPMPNDANVESTLIHFKHGTSGNWKHWTSELEKFLHRKHLFNLNFKICLTKTAYN